MASIPTTMNGSPEEVGDRRALRRRARLAAQRSRLVPPHRHAPGVLAPRDDAVIVVGDGASAVKPEAQPPHSLPPGHPARRHQFDLRRMKEDQPMLPLLLTVRQAAELLGVGRTTLYELMDAGELHSVHRGASRRIPLWAAYEYVDRLCDHRYQQVPLPAVIDYLARGAPADAQSRPAVGGSHWVPVASGPARSTAPIHRGEGADDLRERRGA
jgi:excisionase family DNA binding protein